MTKKKLKKVRRAKLLKKKHNLERNKTLTKDTLQKKDKDTMKNELDYLYEITKDDVKDYYMIDYHLYSDWNGKKVFERHVRSPYLTSRQVAIISATLDWSYVENFRVHSYRDLVEPVNEDGLTKLQCEYREIEFTPLYQKAEHIFGRIYRINRDSLLRWSDTRKEYYKQGMYVSPDKSVIVYSSLRRAA